MRVGVNTLFLIPNEVGGSQTYLLGTLLAYAKEFTDDEVILFTNRENDEFFKQYFRELGRQFLYQLIPVNARIRPSRIFAEQTFLPARLSRVTPHVLWSPGYTAPLAAKLPHVLSVLDMQYKTFKEDLSLFARLATEALVQSGVRLCTRITTLSEFSKGEIIKFTSLSAEKIDVIYPGVDVSWFRLADDREAESLLGPLGLWMQTYALTIANTYPHKRVDLALCAYSYLKNHLPALKFVLVGKPGRGEPAVQSAIKRCQDVIRFEYLPLRTLQVLLQRAGVFIFPSAYEGFGLPVLEAMASGTPLIVRPCASIPEIERGHAVYVSTDEPEAWARAAYDVLAWRPERRAAWAARARELASGFRWANTARGLRQSFGKALHERAYSGK